MRFGVLGPLTVWSDDGTPVAVPESKVRALLADLLTSPGQVVSADRLIEELWGGALPANPTGALQTLVSRLRRVLARAGATETVLHRAPGYLLAVASEAVDTGRFAALTERARTAVGHRERADLLADALALWRGPAFADFADEPFARPAIARWEEQRLLALEEQAEARLELGDHGPLAGELAGLTDRHPLRERLRAAHMRALYGAGRASEALDSYHDLRRRLNEELGLDPSPELTALHQEILRQSPALRRPPGPAGTSPHALPVQRRTKRSPAPEPGGPGTPSRHRARTNLPTAVTALIGRAESVDEVGARVRADRLVTLIGPGGVGKTRLAVEVAARLAPEYRDGVWLVELATQTVTAPSGDELAELVAATLGVRDDTGSGLPPGDRPHTLLDRLVDALRGRRLLLVLDNCEHVIEAAARLTRALLEHAPGVRVLATSQEPLDIAGEQVWPVPPLDLPDPAAPAAVLARSSAVQLFLARARATLPGLELTDDNAAAVAAICRRLDGLPLALELASSRVRVLGVDALAERLDDRFRLLTTGRRGAPARQQTLRAMIDWSWDLLTAAERTVLRRLAVHADGCSLEAAEAVCSGDGVKPPEVLDLLARLVDRSLVFVTHEVYGPRYRLLESVAAYCLERLRAGEYERVRRAHAHYYASLAERADSFLRGGRQQEWLRRLDAETANVRAALDGAAADGDGRLMLRLARAMVWYWFLRGRLGEARRSLSRALEVAGAPGADGAGDVERAEAAAWRTGMSLLSGDADGLAGNSGSVLVLYDGLRDSRVRTRAGWFLGHALIRFGDQSVGEELLGRVLAQARALGDRWGVAAGLGTRGMQAYVCGDLDSSRRDGEESLALFGELGDRWGQLQAMAVLGRVAETGGDYARAGRLHGEGLRVAEELGLWTDVSTRLSELGRTALLAGDHARADELHERGRRLAVEQGDKPAEEYAEIGLGLSARRQGRLDDAEAYLGRWLEWNRQFEAANGAALILAELGFVAELRGDAETALARHREGLTAARATGDPRAIALAWEGLAGARALAGRHEHAAALLGAAAAARASVGAPLPDAERGDVNRVETTARTALGDAAFRAAYERGATLDPDIPELTWTLSSPTPLCRSVGRAAP